MEKEKSRPFFGSSWRSSRKGSGKKGHGSGTPDPWPAFKRKEVGGSVTSIRSSVLKCQVGVSSFVAVAE